MKKITIALVGLLLMTSCKSEVHQTPSTEGQQQETQPVSVEMMESAVIYEANIRQYSPEGTFDAFTEGIPELKDLGVKIIWLMPIYPISEVRRKATNDLSLEDIEDPEERKKYLGSYYAIADYTGVNSEFGTKEDLQELVDVAHENGMYVILDWVANHTGWDHHWIEEHPEYYTTNEQGEIIDPLDPTTGESWGWTDVADLDYGNRELWDAMTAEMKYWVEEHDIDGFRADVAGEVPTEFWEQAVPQLEEARPLFMLAESEKKSLFHNAFDMGYNWEGHHLKNQLAQGKVNVEAWDDYMKKIDTTYQEDDFLMNFITNHDENSWNGTIRERMGDASEAILAMSYTIPGMPLIYSGQEYDLNHRLRFFKKDTIPKTKGKAWPVLERLGKLKNTNPALNGGKKAASYKRLSTSADEQVLAFKREKEDENLVFLANMNKEEVNFNINYEGEFEDYMNSKGFEIKQGEEIKLAPWEYKILIKK